MHSTCLSNREHFTKKTIYEKTIYEKTINEKENTIMKKSIRNLVIGAVMACGVFTASSAALAGTQYVQTNMNFRNGTSTSAPLIGSVPAGAQVEVLGQSNGWDLIRYNGQTGYICGGNLGNSYGGSGNTSVSNYFDTNFVQTAHEIANSGNGIRTVSVNGYLALRNAPCYDAANEIGKLHTGDTVELVSTYNTGSYVEVFAPKLGCYGYVNAGFIR